MVFWDTQTHTLIAPWFTTKESYLNCISWFISLKKQGLNPESITIDGQVQVIKAVKAVWPKCLIQRCVYHILRQGQMWLRRYPKSSLAHDLKKILSVLPKVKNLSDKDSWWLLYLNWKRHHQNGINSLDSKHKVDSDIIKTYRMIENARLDMFHYLDNPKIPSTSNALESYFATLKKQYKKHAGLRNTHLKNYLSWYIYLKNK